MAADKTFGLKVTEDVFNRAKNLIDVSGLTGNEWLEKAVALFELNSIKQSSSDYTQDLTELEHHTTRMYELIANMIQRSVYLKDHAVKEVTDKLESKDSIIDDLQLQRKNLKADLDRITQTADTLQEQLNQAEEKLIANKTTIENNQALINEYKEKNDVLNGLVAQYKGYDDENKALKGKLSEVQTQLTARALKAENQVAELTRLLEVTKAEVESAKQRSEEAIQMIIERKDLERDKAIVDLERKHQVTVGELNATHTEEIRALYSEIGELRNMIDLIKEKHQAEITALKERKDKQ